MKRLLFASTHCPLDPSSGAALATRDLLELMAEHGVSCRAVGAGVLDYEAPTSLETVLGALGVRWRYATAATGQGGAAEVLEAISGGVGVMLVPTRTSLAHEAPDPREARIWLDVAEPALDEFRPEVLLTYGGHPAGLELMRRARKKGIAVVFHLHNFAYRDRSAFVDADAVLVPSEYARRHYARVLGQETTAIPYPLRPRRVIGADPDPTYLTFVNPQPAKGASVAARIALELGRKRPEIPILIVEGRGGAQGLAGSGLDLSGLANLHAMANTPDPRDFYRASRAVLVPSLWRETFGRVAAEAMANGLPVLASDRGALPETLGDAGFCLHIPLRVGPDGSTSPSAREVSPWVALVERLWGDPAFEASHQDRARAEAARWDDARIAARYGEFFASCGLAKKS